MSEIQKIKELTARTGSGMRACREALAANDGDMEKAAQFLLGGQGQAIEQLRAETGLDKDECEKLLKQWGSPGRVRKHAAAEVTQRSVRALMEKCDSDHETCRKALSKAEGKVELAAEIVGRWVREEHLRLRAEIDQEIDDGTLVFSKLYELGLKDISLLSKLEQQIFFIHDMHVIEQMEGFTHYFMTERNANIPAICSTLKEVGAVNVSAIEGMRILIGERVPSWEPDEVGAFLFDTCDEEIEPDERSFPFDPELAGVIAKHEKEYSDGASQMWRAIELFVKEEHGLKFEW